MAVDYAAFCDRDMSRLKPHVDENRKTAAAVGAGTAFSKTPLSRSTYRTKNFNSATRVTHPNLVRMPPSQLVSNYLANSNDTPVTEEQAQPNEICPYHSTPKNATGFPNLKSVFEGTSEFTELLTPEILS